MPSSVESLPPQQYFRTADFSPLEVRKGEIASCLAVTENIRTADFSPLGLMTVMMRLPRPKSGSQ